MVFDYNDVRLYAVPRIATAQLLEEPTKDVFGDAIVEVRRHPVVEVNS